MGYKVAFQSLGCAKNLVNTEQMMALGLGDLPEMLRPLPRHQLLHGGHHIGVAPRAQQSVHLRQLLPDLAGVTLAETARHQQLVRSLPGKI